jgi:transposase
VVCDGGGTPLAVEVTPGQSHESTQFEKVIDAVPLRDGQLPQAISGDKAYGLSRIRQWLQAHHVRAVIPTKSNQARRPDFDRQAYRQRNVVERCIGWLKECRRIATRFEKLAVNFLAMLKVAMIQRYLRLAL